MANLSAFGGAQPITPGGLVELASTSVVDEVFITDSTPSGTANVVPNISVVCDGSPVLVELYSPMAYPDPFSAASWFSLGLVYDGARTGSGNGHWTYMQNDGTGYDINPLYLSMRMTPTAGVHTFGVNGYRNVGTARVGGTTSQRGMDAIQFRVSKIVQQNDGLKPFWTPPLVTQLPGNPTVGDTVIYAADATNGVYWHLYYDGIGSYPWKCVGGAPMFAAVNTAQTTASASYAALATAGPSITAPLAGDYIVTIECASAHGGTNWPVAMSYDIGGTAANDTWAAWAVAPGGYYQTGHRQYRHNTLAASTALVSKYRSPTSNTVTITNRSMSITPVRVA